MAATDLPLALPLASSGEPSDRKEHASAAPTSAGNTPRTTRTRSQSERLGRHGLAALRRSLSERDWAMLRSVAEHRFLTTKQLERLHFTDHTTPASAARSCRYAVRHLAEQRLIRSLARRIGGLRAGSASYVWTTDVVGRRLLTTDTDTPPRRHAEPSERFLQHALAIAETHLALIDADRRGDLELLRVELEPSCWRPYLTGSGSRAVLQPDLLVTTGAGEFEDAWFIEVDLGTEHPPTLLRKCEQYQAYRATGIEQARYGGFPWVVWLLSTEDRVERFREAVARARSLDRDLFRLTTPTGLLGELTTHN
jgi:hypothetical protein